MAKQPVVVKEKKKGLFRRIKESLSELKKVTWPTLKKTIGKTMSVLAVVLFFGVILMLIDLGLSELYKLLMSGLS